MTSTHLSQEIQLTEPTDVSIFFRDFVWKIHRKFPVIVKILVVVDFQISLTPGPFAFGFGRVVELIRNTSVCTMRFDVTLAVRQFSQQTNPSPAPDEPKYTGFRFDQTEPDGKNTIDLFP